MCIRQYFMILLHWFLSYVCEPFFECFGSILNILWRSFSRGKRIKATGLSRILNRKALHPERVIHQLHLTDRPCEEGGVIQKHEFGTPNILVPEKVILLVGEMGSGKTTLINAMVNYIFGVDWGDNFRFKMISEPLKGKGTESQTTKITSYTIHHQDCFSFPYTLTIIDTPGFSDLTMDNFFIDQIRQLFSTEGPDGIDHVDMVGVVSQSSLPRLTPTLRYVFDQIPSLINQDITQNTFLLITFADSRTPPILSAVKEARIPFKNFYKFNNSALYARFITSGNDDREKWENTESEFDEMFWQIGTKSFRKMFTELQKIEGRSVYLTRESMVEKQKIYSKIFPLKSGIMTGLKELTFEQKVEDEYYFVESENKSGIMTGLKELTFEQKVKDEYYFMESGNNNDDTQKKVLQMINEVTELLNRVNDLSNVPSDFLTTTDCIDLLMTLVETSTVDPDEQNKWKKELKQLREICQ